MSDTTVNNNEFLGTAKIGKLLMKFSIPSLLTLLIAGLYGIVDQIFVGNSKLGYLGNGATGIVFPLIILAQAFVWWIGDGCATYLSLCQGRGDTKSANKKIASSTILTLLISLVLMGVILIFKKEILLLFGASEVTLPLAEAYVTIIASFFPLYMLLNMLNPIIRADGSPIYALIATGIGAVLNIGLDPIFIFAVDMGIEGAAWATVISQILSFVLSFIYLFKTKTFRLKISDYKFSFKETFTPLRLGISSFITHFSIVLQTFVTNRMMYEMGVLSIYGSDIPISVISIQSKVFSFLVDITIGIMVGGMPIISYNYGAKNYKRVKQTFSLIAKIIFVITLVFTLVNEIYPETFILMFGLGEGDPTLYLQFAKLTFRCYMACGMLACFNKIISSFFQSIEKPKLAILMPLFNDIFLYCPLVIAIPLIISTFSPENAIYGTMVAYPIADIITFTLGSILLYKVYKKLY